MPLNIDLQAITWKKCKDDVFEHIATGHATLKDYLNHTSKCNKIYWFAFIEGNDQYGSHNVIALRSHLPPGSHSYSAHKVNGTAQT
ncbi:hypothetical protein PCASD_11849 [Puccinia coronata f. sp. avenae]|uniref:Uncharacterized protein n=1 Tax=Puccinia coronata f. sp. avenae TaxID=200324 RepID=A0A2N5UTN8_9BASI|nr:hypothetical protein PCASD_11849 [Puccinia coronata f. sp. avenae]